MYLSGYANVQGEVEIIISSSDREIELGRFKIRCNSHESIDIEINLLKAGEV